MRGDVEVVVLVAAVGLGLAQVPAEAGAPQHRAGDAEGEAAGDVEVAHALGALLPDGVAGEQALVVVQALGHVVEEFADHGHGLRGEVLCDAAGADVGHVHAQARDGLEDVEDLLAVPEAVDHHRQGAQLHAGGGERDQVRGDPVELHHDDADDVGPLGDGDAQELLDGEAVAGLVEDRREVVGAGDEGAALRPGAVFEVLLDAGVEVADDGPQGADGLALQFADQAEHAVRGRVLRAEVDDEALVVDRVDGGDEFVPVAAGDGVDLAFGGLALGCIGVFVGEDVVGVVGGGHR